MYRVKVRVKEFCQQRNWNLNELALHSGVTYATFDRYAIQPMAKIDIDSVSRIKERFGCS